MGVYKVLECLKVDQYKSKVVMPVFALAIVAPTLPYNFAYSQEGSRRPKFIKYFFYASFCFFVCGEHEVLVCVTLDGDAVCKHGRRGIVARGECL